MKEINHSFPLDILSEGSKSTPIDYGVVDNMKQLIINCFVENDIDIFNISYVVGPTVVRFEFIPKERVMMHRVRSCEDKLNKSLSGYGPVRLEAPVPGKGSIAVEVPRPDPQTVCLRNVLESKDFQVSNADLPIALGIDTENNMVIADMAKMSHLLVAGATGMGKSVALNAIITSLIYKKHPSELKFVLVDQKMVEFSLYSKIERSYLAKLPNEEDAIISDMDKMIQTLNALCVEMDNRYELLRNAGVRYLEEYNCMFAERRLNPNDGHRYLPYIVVVVDEFAELIMILGKEVETLISRIAMKGRPVGMRMILATQRPTTNVITGLIKANFFGRIAFRVVQSVDSRTILDCPGANRLIGRGDMLFSYNGSIKRVQCAFISTEEVEAITEYIDSQIGYEDAYYLPEYVSGEAEGGVMTGTSTDCDSLFDEAVRFVVSRFKDNK